ncbi:MAG: ABC transporter permease [Deltaproteobacteria bacterium]|nr:ABC transporter permease [Deltaproteobacteria bacterium]
MKTRGIYRAPRSGWTARHVSLWTGVACLLPLALGVVLALAGWLPADPAAGSGTIEAPVSAAHWLGTDALGRDTLSRLASASANFAGPGLLAAAVALLIGTMLGVAGEFAGPAGGAVAHWLLQVIDAVPKFVLVLLVAAIARSEIAWVMAAVGLTFAPQIAGGIRQSVERLRATAFIEAEHSLGVGLGRIVFVHILWGHARRLVLGQLTTLVAYALLVESSLSYLGGELGIQEPAASWGNMIARGRDGVFSGHLLPVLLPAGAISVTLLGWSLLGRGLLGTIEDPP